jgi:hypothetical protein
MYLLLKEKKFIVQFRIKKRSFQTAVFGPTKLVVGCRITYRGPLFVICRDGITLIVVGGQVIVNGRALIQVVLGGEKYFTKPFKP